ncbi:putative phospholipid-transporting ATPase 9 [Drosera capensis]
MQSLHLLREKGKQINMANGTRRWRLQLSKIYAFSCIKPSVKDDDQSQIGGPVFSRVVYCNDPESGRVFDYANNYVKTTKYTPATFIPKALFEQFRRVENFFFLLTGILAFTPIALFSSSSAIVPLVFVIGDREVNNRKVKLHRGHGNFEYTQWRHLRVGDVVKDAICYVETMNLDGETNLKLKQALEVTSLLLEDSNFVEFRAIIRCEDPNANLYSFVGTMDLQDEQHALSPQQLLLRDSKLQNTDYVYGAVIFTGHDTKVMQNSTDPPSKRSRVERNTDYIIYFMFFMLFVIAFIGSIFFGITTKDDLKNGVMTRWYLRADSTTVHYDPKRAPLATFLDSFDCCDAG